MSNKFTAHNARSTAFQATFTPLSPRNMWQVAYMGGTEAPLCFGGVIKNFSDFLLNSFIINYVKRVITKRNKGFIEI